MGRDPGKKDNMMEKGQKAKNKRITGNKSMTFNYTSVKMTWRQEQQPEKRKKAGS